jgi:hypothetical protein
VFIVWSRRKDEDDLGQTYFLHKEIKARSQEED